MMSTVNSKPSIPSVVFPDGPISASIERPSDDDLSELDGYLADGDWETAREVLDLLAEMFPNAPEVAERRDRLETALRPAPEPEIEQALSDMLGETTEPEADGDLLSFLDDLPAMLAEESAPESETEEEDDERLDFETHYSRAVVYRDMELHAKVVRELEKAFRAEPPPAGAAAGLFECRYLLGQAHAALGDFERAAEHFLICLDAPCRDEDEYQAVRYDLASVRETAGHLDQAAETFSEILTFDINYRDVRERLADLRARVA